jgi:GNAT superfamily N-acetyltransferase
VPPSLLVRHAQPDDRPTIAAFNAALALETEGKTLVPEVVARGVAFALDHPEWLRYWVAEIDGRIVAQTAMNREWSDWRDGWVWWLQSVYVHPDFRGQGVFRALYQQIRAEARAEADVIGIRLYVDDRNTRGQRVYQALGLTPGGYHVYEELWRERFNRSIG